MIMALCMVFCGLCVTLSANIPFCSVCEIRDRSVGMCGGERTAIRKRTSNYQASDSVTKSKSPDQHS
jgi:hypothetical protein